MANFKTKSPLRVPSQQDPITLDPGAEGKQPHQQQQEKQSDLPTVTAEEAAPGGDIQPDKEGGVTIAPTPKKSSAA